MLLIVDAQVNQFEPPMAVHDGPLILDRLKRLLARARSSHIPVAFIQNDGGEADPDLPGTPGWALHPALLPHGSEKVYRKKTTDSFHETGLLEDLRAAGITDLIIAGMQSNYCIDATTRRAAAEGFNVTLVSDAHSTFSFSEIPAEQMISEINAKLSPLVLLRTTDQVTFS
jgi:nicotinamidase-related amidase